MAISIFELFSIGIGPSSSHTVGPMRAAHDFIVRLEQAKFLPLVASINVDLYGSLALTGKGHGTDKAILNGLEGKEPETVDSDTLVPRMEAIINNQEINLSNHHTIPFNFEKHFQFHQKKTLPKHSNGMKFSVFDKNNQLLFEDIYYSIGGGFIVTDDTFGDEAAADHTTQPYPYTNAKTLLDHCRKANKTIADIVLANEMVWRDEETIKQSIHDIANIMFECIERGVSTGGTLPGGLHVKRRAPELYQKLHTTKVHSIHEETDILNLLNIYAMAVCEENAVGRRIVTAPTNGVAGIIPAVLEYYRQTHHGDHHQGIIDFFLTAGAIGILYKKGASISGSEVGCQGEVGVASSMAAAGLTAALGGSLEQIENAAEIAMEHHLGMTCDPIGGLVQIPCIERNAMGAVKAVNATRLALLETEANKITLDKVIATMKKTGEDMMTHYKETSQGGLALNLPEC